MHKAASYNNNGIYGAAIGQTNVPINSDAYAQAQCLKDAVVAQPATGLEGILGHAHSILNFVQHQGERIERLDGKLHGINKGQSAQSAPEPCGLIGQINYTLNAIMVTLQATDETLSNISRAI